MLLENIAARIPSVFFPPLSQFFFPSPAEELHGAFQLCPGMVVSGLLLFAEAHYFAFPPPADSRDPLHMAKSYMQFLNLAVRAI